jgi:RNA polymerase sigma-70 factor, ECF subfamily
MTAQAAANIGGIPLSCERFEDLVDQHGRLVLNVAFRILGNAAAAQDVHQEVFLAIWRRWGSFNNQVHWRSYLYRTTVRKAIETATRARSVHGSVPAGQEPVTSGGPESALCAAELQQKLAEALAQLPDRQAEVFVLSRFEGLSHEQISELLSCTRETVRVHLYRALKRLAEDLREYL